MDKKTQAFRHSDAQYALVEKLCQANRMSLSTFYITALRHYLNLMEAEGIISPYNPMEDDGQSPAVEPDPQVYAYPEEDEDFLYAAEELQDDTDPQI